MFNRLLTKSDWGMLERSQLKLFPFPATSDLLCRHSGRGMLDQRRKDVHVEQAHRRRLRVFLQACCGCGQRHQGELVSQSSTLNPS